MWERWSEWWWFIHSTFLTLFRIHPSFNHPRISMDESKNIWTSQVQFMDQPIQGIIDFQALGYKWTHFSLKLLCLKDGMNSCVKINYNMLLSSLRKTGLVQLFTCQLFEPPFLNQEVEIQVAPGLEQGIYPPHSCSSLGCRTSLLGVNITNWMCGHGVWQYIWVDADWTII